jgi:hypothetical protein
LLRDGRNRGGRLVATIVSRPTGRSGGRRGSRNGDGGKRRFPHGTVRDGSLLASGLGFDAHPEAGLRSRLIPTPATLFASSMPTSGILAQRTVARLSAPDRN